MPSLLVPDMEMYEQWSEALGVPFDHVLRKAGVSDPDDARASRARMRQGGAPRVRKALHGVLAEMERKREAHTEIGALIMGVEEWRDLGAELADLDPKKFAEMLDALRKRVNIARESKDSESTFFDIKPPAEPKR